MINFRRPLLFSRRLPVERHAVNENVLIAQLQRLTITPPIQPMRFFHATAAVFKDKHHLDRHGIIKEFYLKFRRDFLSKHRLLQDEVVFQEHRIFENRHLYRMDDIDIHGETNLQRMLKGKAPITREGKDYLVIHHFDQTHDGDWIVLPNSFHERHDSELHSQIKVRNRVIRHVFAKERIAYWQHVANTHLEKQATFRIRKK
ncbi:MAG: HNH/ENDO VII family nuclease [Candidatus Berkiella sp.]